MWLPDLDECWGNSVHESRNFRKLKQQLMLLQAYASTPCNIAETNGQGVKSFGQNSPVTRRCAHRRLWRRHELRCSCQRGHWACSRFQRWSYERCGLSGQRFQQDLMRNGRSWRWAMPSFNSSCQSTCQMFASLNCPYL
ncbi:unnamed protein product [Symbiodinium natans]|uniref:Uncharacterized protein n=1 Tax=Symbiodinium natans TaxID=878477 RepID=A0A812NBZ4_9DINO|nr:unnamed protein product [Symbiodinium natans]